MTSAGCRSAGRRSVAFEAADGNALWVGHDGGGPARTLPGVASASEPPAIGDRERPTSAAGQRTPDFHERRSTVRRSDARRRSERWRRSSASVAAPPGNGPPNRSTRSGMTGRLDRRSTAAVPAPSRHKPIVEIRNPRRRDPGAIRSSRRSIRARLRPRIRGALEESGVDTPQRRRARRFLGLRGEWRCSTPSPTRGLPDRGVVRTRRRVVAGITSEASTAHSTSSREARVTLQGNDRTFEGARTESDLTGSGLGTV